MTPRGEGASIEDNVQRLTDGLSKTVKFYNSSHPETPLSPDTPLLLAGELLAEATTSKLIQAEIDYPIEPLVPPLEFSPDLPLAIYATNMGLALKKMPQKTATRLHDVNLNILSDKYRAKVRPVALRYILFSLTVIIAIGLLFPLYQVKSQADAETMHLQTELATLSQELHQARLAFNQAEQDEDTINKLAADVETIRQEHQYIMSQRGDFASNLELVTNALPSEANFTYLEIGTDQLVVVGEAASSFTVISYAKALEAQGGLSEVRIAEIDEPENTESAEAESPGVSFKIIITR
jgi:type IV pilus assembly protein PilM